MVKNIIQFCLKWRHLLTGAILILSIFSSVIFLKHFGDSDNSLPVWFEEHDVHYEAYNNFLKHFGHDRYVVIAFEVPEVFTQDVLTMVYELTEALKKSPEIERVSSITHTDQIEGTADILEIHPLFSSIADITSDPVLLERKKEIVMHDDDLVGHLISSDRHVVAILARVSTESFTESNRALKTRLEQIIQKLNSHQYPYHLAGPPITDLAFDDLAVRDQTVFFPAILGCVIFLILIFFRSLFIAIVPAVMQGIVLSLILALYHGLGYKMNVSMGMIVPILVAVCIADSVHVMLEYYHERSLGHSKETALVAAGSNLWWPCLFTAATTLAGFVSFQASSIPPINMLGIMTALGVALAFLFTIFFIPVVLSYLPEPKKEVAIHVDEHYVQQFLNFCGSLNRRWPGVVAGVTVFIFALSLWGMSFLTIETNFSEYFPSHHPVRHDIEFFNTHLAGAVEFDVVFGNDQSQHEIATDPKVLLAVDQFISELKTDPQTREVISLIPFIKKMSQSLHGGDLNYKKIPDSRSEMAQLYFLAESGGGTEFQQFKRKDNTQLRVSVNTPIISSEKLDGYLDDVQKKAEKYLSPLGVSVEITGTAPLWVHLDHAILVSQIWSFILAFGVVMVMMMIVLRSVKAGLISMIPNILPIFMTLGLMGFLKIHLNVATVMIAGVTVGITVDDTIHYLTRFKEMLKECAGNYELAMEKTNRTIGTAIVFTSCVLVGGFGIMVLGSFVPSVTFGSMSALTLFLSIFCEVILTPLLVVKLKPFGKIE